MLVDQIMRGMALDVDAIYLDPKVATQIRCITGPGRTGEEIKTAHAGKYKGANFVKLNLDTAPSNRSANMLRHDPLLKIKHGGNTSRLGGLGPRATLDGGGAEEDGGE